MLENIKRIRAIDYTDIGKIPNYVEEVVKKTLEILEKPNIFGKKEKNISFAIEKAMDIIALRHFSESEEALYDEDFIKINEINKKIMDEIPEEIIL